jgi:hypothetical protein
MGNHDNINAHIQHSVSHSQSSFKVTGLPFFTDKLFCQNTDCYNGNLTVIDKCVASNIKQMLKN